MSPAAKEHLHRYLSMSGSGVSLCHSSPLGLVGAVDDAVEGSPRSLESFRAGLLRVGLFGVCVQLRG